MATWGHGKLKNNTTGRGALQRGHPGLHRGLCARLHLTGQMGVSRPCHRGGAIRSPSSIGYFPDLLFSWLRTWYLSQKSKLPPGDVLSPWLSRVYTRDTHSFATVCPLHFTYLPLQESPRGKRKLYFLPYKGHCLPYSAFNQ